MKYLIDTQILIWFQLNDRQLKPAVKAILTERNNQIFVSDVSLYEIAIKKKVNKLPHFIASVDDVIDVIQKDKFKFMAISHSHILAYDNVPYLETHKDPFDRLLIATALAEGLSLISADEKFEMYTSIISVIKA
jgi:PIN domain nuclease of toxin-antitoxin system